MVLLTLLSCNAGDPEFGVHCEGDTAGTLLLPAVIMSILTGTAASPFYSIGQTFQIPLPVISDASRGGAGRLAVSEAPNRILNFQFLRFGVANDCILAFNPIQRSLPDTEVFESGGILAVQLDDEISVIEIFPRRKIDVSLLDIAQARFIALNERKVFRWNDQ